MTVVDFSNTVFRPATIDKSPIIMCLVNAVIDNKLRRTAKSATSSSSKNVLFMEQRAYSNWQNLCNKITTAVQCKLTGR